MRPIIGARPSGIQVGKMRRSPRVVGHHLRSSRPNVTADAAALPQIGQRRYPAWRLGGHPIQSAPSPPPVQEGLHCRRPAAGIVQVVDTTDRAAVGGELITLRELSTSSSPRGGRA